MAKHNVKMAPAKYNKIGETAVVHEISPFSRARVNIIIPFHGQYEKVTRLVESILRLARSNPYQICLVDDASPNEDYLGFILNSPYGKAPEGTLPQVMGVRSEVQLGFGGACKLGYDHTEQPWMMFMHSDCVVEDGDWMIEMGKSLLTLKEKKVRMVCSRTNYTGDPMFESPKEAMTRDLILNEEVLPLHCFMCHRELFKHIGGFIKSYPYGWYEDEELAFRMKKSGFKQAVCGNSWVHHEGGATFGTLWKHLPHLAESVMEENRQRCLADIKKMKG